MTRVAICIITCQRPKGLARLLDSLAHLSFVKSTQPDLRVVVVDNDAAGSARSMAEAAAAFLPWPLQYTIEPRRGIPMARNRAVACAIETDFIAFIDDDEVATPSWLDELLYVQSVYKTAIVAGPVLPRFVVSPPPWILQGRFFDHPRYATGMNPQNTATGNVLVERQCLRQVPGPFHEKFALIGGEDTHLFIQLQQRGAQVVWADEAVVEEFVPASRMTVGWILWRAYRWGSSSALYQRDMLPFWRWWLRCTARGAIVISQGLGLLLRSVGGKRATIVLALCDISLGVGTWGGLLGLHYQEYRSIHGE